MELYRWSMLAVLFGDKVGQASSIELQIADFMKLPGLGF
jgi:hypothetical protein